MSGFFALLFRQKYINRWNLMKNIERENLSQHSYEVAVIAHSLCEIGNKIYGKHYSSEHAACLALFHDVPEVFTGDLPTPVKYFSADSKENYSAVEKIYTDRLISTLPGELKNVYSSLLEPEYSDEKKMVKIADKLAAYIKCLNELNYGNRDFATALESTKQSLADYSCPELDYFLDHFMSDFDKTLDELQIGENDDRNI